MMCEVEIYRCEERLICFLKKKVWARTGFIIDNGGDGEDYAGSSARECAG